MGITVQITPDEIRLFQLLEQGYNHKELSRILNVSPATAKAHIEKLRNKTGCDRTIQLVSFAYKHKILNP